MKRTLRRVQTVALAALMFIFPIVANAQYTETVLYTFPQTSTDASFPSGGLILDAGSNLYGVGAFGGANNHGAVYELSPVSGGGWTEQVIYSFAGGRDGQQPGGNLAIDAGGNLYGTTASGGTGTCQGGCGQVYELSPTSTGWTKTILHSFKAFGDGQGPGSDVIFDSAGNLYGTTWAGGAHALGVVYELSPTSSGWTETILYSFNGNFGQYPGSLAIDAAGRLYGTTYAGGTSTRCLGGCGSIYQLTPPTSSGWWTFRRLHSFNNADGESPSGDSLVFDATGNVYGTTVFGGTAAAGTVYELSPTAGGGWKEHVLHSFEYGDNGASPVAGVVFDSADNLWGTTAFTAEDSNDGTVFELTPISGGHWSFARVYGFKGGSDGVSPHARVVFDPSGNVYGTTVGGSIANEGTVFELSSVVSSKK